MEERKAEARVYLTELTQLRHPERKGSVTPAMERSDRLVQLRLTCLIGVYISRSSPMSPSYTEAYNSVAESLFYQCLELQSSTKKGTTTIATFVNWIKKWECVFNAVQRWQVGRKAV